MDRETLAAYDTLAPAFVRRWLGEEAPADMYALFRRFFRPGLTADIGSGSGRDAAWLSANGFPTIGYDVSDGLLALARARYPHIEFSKAALPDLAGVPERHFENVCCETVIMHLPREEIAPAVARMAAIIKPGGVIYLSWRVTEDADCRETDGRLFSAFDARLVHGALPSHTILFDEPVPRPTGGFRRRLFARLD
jgi:SAM-dependent methyltransferase